MIGLALAGILVAPLLVLALAFLRALILFWPTMVVLGALHTQIPAVPALGWWATFLLVAALGLLVPTSDQTS